MSRRFNCRRCGHCCLTLVDAYRGCVSDADLERWRAAGRNDLLARIETLDLGPGNRLHLAWMDPTTKEEVDRCPWLLVGADGHACAIEALKPDHCRNFPEHRRHAESVGCPGYDNLSGTKP
jgi:Fe-S-cluster containining protein